VASVREGVADRACGGGENLREVNHLEDPSLDGRIILRCNFRKWNSEGMDWIDLAQDRDRWRALENVVIKIRVL
jgi:hypothetical protein